ncbi:MAG: cobalamin-binding protein [Chloroflexota bacterium]|nr:MAG: cobalamin-binding protein [Chloroflexota bacterium]
METTLQLIYDGIIEGDQPAVSENVRKALDEGTPPATILNQAMIAAMKEVGSRFEQGDFYVPEMLIAARAMQHGLAILKPVLKQADIKSTGKAVIGTVKGDLHDIGKNLVGMMLEGAGFEVVDLGTDVSPSGFVDAVRKHEPDVVGLSALLTTTMPNMKMTIEALEEAGIRDRVKVMIGGAPITEGYALQIGADGYSPDASRAVTLATTLVHSK